MSYFNIPLRTSRNPRLSIKETNVIITTLNNILHSHNDRRESANRYGSSLTYFHENDRPIQVIFDEDYPPYSIFGVEMSGTEPPVHHAHAIQKVNKTPNRKDISTSKDTIYCTNGGDFCKENSTSFCHIIGYTVPYRIRYNGTVPGLGSRLYPVPAQTYVSVNSYGPLLCCGMPNEDEEWVWVIRHERIMEIYGTVYNSDITYGSTGEIEVWRNLTNQHELVEVSFKFLGKSGDSIPVGTGVHARWFDDLNDGVGGWLITNSNCDPFP